MQGTYHNYALFANSNNLFFYRALIHLFPSWKENGDDEFTHTVVTSRNTYARIATGTISFDRGNTTFAYKHIIVLIDENAHYTSLILDPDDLNYRIYVGQIQFSFEGQNERFGSGLFANKENQLNDFLRNNYIIEKYCSLISIRCTLIIQFDVLYNIHWLSNF